jgi:hypothetical protein
MKKKCSLCHALLAKLVTGHLVCWICDRADLMAGKKTTQ